MKKIFESILSAIKPLSDNSQKYIIGSLKQLNNRIAYLEYKLEEKTLIISGKTKNSYSDNLEKATDLLKIFGYNEDSFKGVNPDFITWMLSNTLINTKFNPKLQNKYIIDSFQQAWYLTRTDKEEPTYNEVRNTLLTFDETIEQYKKESKRSLEQLIKDLNGES